MLATATQAIIPKARGMYAKHFTTAEYEELLRRRTVAEVAAILKRHPYYKESLATLSTIDPHRGQLEELLSMDIFNKYAALVKYDYSGAGFSGYYRRECEIREVLRALQLLSTGLPGTYIKQIPSYLVGQTEIDLFALGQAQNFAQVLEVVRRTPYYKALRGRWIADPYLRDFAKTEAALLRASFEEVFSLIEKTLSGREAEAVRGLFLYEIEKHNLELLMRLKTYFPGVYSENEIHQLLLPFYLQVSKRRFEEMIRAPSPEALLAMYRGIRSLQLPPGATPEDLAIVGSRRVYRHARTVLHLTSSPYVALAAFVSLAKLERENAVNVIEGVRYGLPPEEIRPLLHD